MLDNLLDSGGYKDDYETWYKPLRGQIPRQIITIQLKAEQKSVRGIDIIYLETVYKEVASEQFW